MITQFVQSFIYLYLFKNLKLKDLIINILLCFKDQRFLMNQKQSKTFLIDGNIPSQDKNV